MHKTKRKSTKSVKLPKPIKIKKEKTEEDRSLHPMSHYIDDRLELVKQIFGTLKPKTITNLAPDFLKKKSMDEIEELCLNELLGISTKRLTSIINASKCPTDTESSEDSDVQHKEEHVSLEEISSDSEVGSSSTRAGKKKTNGKNSAANKKDSKKIAKKDENDGQISVLELLELQARARAIRSQLALEPVTKIEVDSEAEEAARKSSKSSTDERSVRKRKSTERENEPRQRSSRLSSSTSTAARPSKASLSGEDNTSANTSEKEPINQENQTSRKIKLKRNYRNWINDKKEKETTLKDTEGDMMVKNERSPSPDVIPIVTEPETLLISDSDGEEGSKKNAKSLEKDHQNENSEKSITALVSDNCAERNVRVRKDTETEEGEITESETERNDESTTESVTQEKPPEVESGKDERLRKQEQLKDDEKRNEADANQAAQEDAYSVAVKNCSNDTPSNNIKEDTETEVDVKSIAENLNAPTTSVNTESEVNLIKREDAPAAGTDNDDDDDDDDDEQNDDVISIEGGDLESEMIEHLGGHLNTQTSITPTIKAEPDTTQQDADVISLNSSEDELDKDAAESWHARYLKSSKVSKVLAESRLGKRVRDKIKKSKHSKKEQQYDAKIEAARAKSNQVFTSKHEDGSVEQYKELLELRSRKT